MQSLAIYALACSFASANVSARWDPKSARPVRKAFSGFNVNLSGEGAGSWRNSSFLEGFEQIGAQIVRYPAGTIAQWWDWRKGWFCDPKPGPCEDIPESFKHRPLPPRFPNGYRLEDLAYANQNGAHFQVVLDLNMISSNLSEQVAMVSHAVELGLSVRYVELGNEFYFPVDWMIKRFPSVESYANEATKYATAVRGATNSSIPIAAVGEFLGKQGPPPYKNGTGRMGTWNEGIRSGFADRSIVQGVILHAYEDLGLADETHLCGPSSSFANCSVQQTIHDEFVHPGGVDQVLSQPYFAIKWLEDVAAPFVADGFDVIITEANLMSFCGSVRQTWTHALWIALWQSMLAGSHRASVSMGLVHALSGNPMFTAMWTMEDSLKDVCLSSKSEDPGSVAVFQPSPPGMAVQLVAAAERYGEGRAVGPIDFEGSVPMSNSSNGQYPALAGVSWQPASGGLDGGSDRTAVLINLSGQEQEVRLDSSLGFNASARVMVASAKAAGWVTQGWSDPRLAVDEGTLGDGQVIGMPAYSIAQVL